MRDLPLHALTQGPRHHFFGYYGISAWDRAQGKHLALETGFHERRPEAGDSARVGLIDLASGRFEALAETAAFNLQQGAMLHWIAAGPEEEFVYNAWLSDGTLGARAVTPANGRSRELRGAVAAVDGSGRVALGLDRARSFHIRAVTGYACGPEHLRGPCPDDDGLFRIDLKDGAGELVLPLRVLRDGAPHPSDAKAFWIDHVHFNPAGTRVLLLFRAQTAQGFQTSLWTVDPDGARPRLEIPFGPKISHFDWFDDETILVSSSVLGAMQFVRFRQGRGDFAAVDPERLPADGHASFSPDRRWLLCDTYPKGQPPACELLLYECATRRRIELGTYASPEPFRGDIRCDLHPRWRPDGRAIGFDSIHEGTRQVYAIDLSACLG
ncbi:MAG: hypothetical protein KIS92_06655 [Planctomycetota bacterium]|nr:hypothetical protein [Planctomycetota bacterium]